MLNRRVLRVKVMQNLFAWHQAMEANFLWAGDRLSELLQPNLNLDLPENKIEMADKEKEAQQLLNKWKESRFTTLDESGDERIDAALNEVVNDFKRNQDKDLKGIRSKMLIEVENLHTYYIKLLQLIIEFSKVENSILQDNKVIEHLLSNQELEAALLKKNVSWSEQKSLVRKIYNDVLLKDEEFIKYGSLDSKSLNDDKAIVNNLMKEVFFKNEDLLEVFQNQDIYWEENKNILKSMLKKTIKDVETGLLLKISQNWEDDKEFFKILFSATVENNEELTELIVEHSKNWKKDRLALTDVIILKMGLAEMMNMPSIPVKVSINEYIEISKSYSTPKSKQFVNGMLDKISDILTKEGKIKKSGRGLIDNK